MYFISQLLAFHVDVSAHVEPLCSRQDERCHHTHIVTLWAKPRMIVRLNIKIIFGAWFESLAYIMAWMCLTSMCGFLRRKWMVCYGALLVDGPGTRWALPRRMTRGVEPLEHHTIGRDCCDVQLVGFPGEAYDEKKHINDQESRRCWCISVVGSMTHEVHTWVATWSKCHRIDMLSHMGGHLSLKKHRSGLN